MDRTLERIKSFNFNVEKKKMRTTGKIMTVTKTQPTGGRVTTLHALDVFKLDEGVLLYVKNMCTHTSIYQVFSLSFGLTNDFFSMFVNREHKGTEDVSISNTIVSL